MDELEYIEYNDFINMLWVNISHVGQENIYFEYMDSKGHAYKAYTKYSG